MTSWLTSLPHQIPFRAASAATFVDDHTVRGEFLVTTNDEMIASESLLALMLFEAMAQIGGSLAFRESREHGYLSAIDDASIESPPRAGDRITLLVTLDAGFGGIYRFRGVAERDGLEFARARFYLSAPAASS